MFDFNFTRNGVAKLESNSKYAMFLLETAKIIYDTGYFRTVDLRVRKDESVACPSCFLYPSGVSIIETALAGSRQNVRYSVIIGIADKHPNDSILMQRILIFAQKIRTAFSLSVDKTRGVLLFSNIEGHYNTEVEGTEVEPLEQLSDDTLIFSSGINLVYYSWDELLNM